MSRTSLDEWTDRLLSSQGHTSYSNNFHISVNDDLAIRYVYRSPLEHMHCALAFQLLKNPKTNVLQGLTKIEQLEVRNLITDVVLATDNAVHSTYLAKLESLVCRYDCSTRVRTRQTTRT